MGVLGVEGLLVRGFGFRVQGRCKKVMMRSLRFQCCKSTLLGDVWLIRGIPFQQYVTTLLNYVRRFAAQGSGSGKFSKGGFELSLSGIGFHLLQGVGFPENPRFRN